MIPPEVILGMVVQSQDATNEAGDSRIHAAQAALWHLNKPRCCESFAGASHENA
jgi:hypothetical protein